MVVPTITRGSMLLRLVCGLWLVGTALASGFMGRSPWSIATLGLAFSVLFIIGKWDAWRLALRTSGPAEVLAGAASVVPTQCVIVGLFYGAGFGFQKLTDASRALQPLSGFDIRYGAIVLGVGAGLALIAHLLESRAGADDGWMRQLIEDDSSLPAELRSQILGSDRDSSAA